MTTTLKDDIRNEPIRIVQQAFAEARAEVKPPDSYRDDLMSPVKAVEQAVHAASQVAGQLSEVQARVDAGAIHKDQAPVLRRRIVDDARRQVDSFTDSGRKVLDALPSHIMSRAWDDAPPTDVDWTTVMTEWESVKADDAVDAFQEMTTDAIGRGDRKTARALMSRRGRALLATRIGKEQADNIFPALRTQATDALRQRGDSTDANPGLAMAQMEQVGKTFDAGANLADMLLQTAEANYDDKARG